MRVHTAMDHVYLDFAATTPVRDEVRAAMAPYLEHVFGNPSSIHRWGREAEEALEGARAELAEAIGASPSEVTFVRGGTESDNIALLGWCAAQREQGAVPSLVIGTIEHHAVLEAANFAERAGVARVARVAVDWSGGVDLDAVRHAAGNGPALVSLMWVNNETGITLPLAEVADAVHGAGATLHSDAAQTVGKVPVDVSEVGVDLLSGTGHKIYAPKGTGFLFAREGTRLSPLLFGGGQEGALRPGTEDVAGAVGLATAVRLAVEEREVAGARMGELRTRLESALMERLDDVRINAGGAERAPHVSSLGIGGVEDGSALVMALDLEGIGVSGGSACTSGATGASHVIRALYGEDDRYATVRFSFGLSSSEVDVDRAIEATVKVVERARNA